MTQEDVEQAVAEIWQLFKETDAKFKETDARFKETDARLDRRFGETDQKLNRLQALFGSQWGKMIEALVQSNALNLFQERGIRVRRLYQRVKSHPNGRTMEVDLILENEGEVIVLEAKSTLRVSDVQDLLADLSEFRTFFPKYEDYRIYGAVAGLEIVEEADRYAYRQGLFMLGIVGEGVVQLKNDADFRPRDFGA